MRSLKNLGDVPASVPLVADDVTELHGARLLLLLKLCGIAGRIEGLTKLAKMDFFVRYPAFFERLAVPSAANAQSRTSTVESSMIRHHYGPWDKRYYQILPFLEARDLISITKVGSAYVFRLTERGKRMAGELEKLPEFTGQVEQMKSVKRVLGQRSGTAIKKLIYELFDAEVARRPLGEVIE
jgi:DNA-binding PadR family transcriptional regulator